MKKEESDFSDALKLRRKAEGKLKGKPVTTETSLPVETDTRRLLHELQVHQIELEMQNEELRKANETAETALKKYTMLYDLSPMGYFTLDNEASICDLNFTGAEMIGDRRFALVNKNFKLFISERSLPMFNKFFGKVFSGNTKESCQLMLRHSTKPLCFVYMEGIVTGSDKRCLLSVMDISGFKQQVRL
jgi:PAS domain-containing protein